MLSNFLRICYAVIKALDVSISDRILQLNGQPGRASVFKSYRFFFLIDLQYLPRARWQFHLSLIFLSLWSSKAVAFSGSFFFKEKRTPPMAAAKLNNCIRFNVSKIAYLKPIWTSVKNMEVFNSREFRQDSSA